MNYACLNEHIDYSTFMKKIKVFHLNKTYVCAREFDSSFFGVLIQILYLSHLRLIFLSNFVIFIVLLCTLCGIIKKTDFIIGEKRYVYIYHWK